MRANVTVAEVTTQVRDLAVEVPIDTGIDQPSVVNGDGLHTVPQRRLIRRIGALESDSVAEVGVAIAVALGCDPA